MRPLPWASLDWRRSASGTFGGRWAVRRWDIWPATWELIKDHPIMGVGFGGYWIAITAYHDASGEMAPQEAHNDYLEFLASGGIIALALGAWFLYLLIRRIREGLRTSNRFLRAARGGAIIGIAAVAVHSLVDFGLHITINAVVFLVLLIVATTQVSSGVRRRLALSLIFHPAQVFSLLRWPSIWSSFGLTLNPFGCKLWATSHAALKCPLRGLNVWSPMKETRCDCLKTKNH